MNTNCYQKSFHPHDPRASWHNSRNNSRIASTGSIGLDSIQMPPIIDHPSLHLRVLPNNFYVVKHDPKSEGWHGLVQNLLTNPSQPGGQSSQLFSVTRTDEEVSIVGECIGPDQEGDWRCLRIAGPMEFSESRGFLSGI